jgi:shikimate kinase
LSDAGEIREGSSMGTLALVGFMAVGKSAVGRLVAACLGLPFIDTDAVIERKAGGIAEFFSVHGEGAFRHIERDVVVAALDRGRREACVVALGGGAVSSSEVRAALGRLPHVVWLTAPLDVLWERTQVTGVTERPLAGDERDFRRRFKARSALYCSVATDKVANDGRHTLEHVAEEVVRIARGRQAGTGPEPAGTTRGDRRRP